MSVYTVAFVMMSMRKTIFYSKKKSFQLLEWLMILSYDLAEKQSPLRKSTFTYFWKIFEKYTINKDLKVNILSFLGTLGKA